METYPISLALFDFIPTIAFLIGGYFLVKISLMMHSRRCSQLAAASVLLIFMGGFLKATWKLLYATGTADVRLMSEVQFFLVAPGFFIMMIVAILVARRRRETIEIPLLAIAPWKIPLLAIMVLSSMAANGILTYVSFKRGVPLAATGFIISFLCLVAMGAMASGEQTLARQWMEEGVNAIGQIGFAGGAFLLHQNVRRFGC